MTFTKGISGQQLKRPRHYAFDILKLDSKQERQGYLQNKVPAEFREWVKTYVKIWWKNRGDFK